MFVNISCILSITGYVQGERSKVKQEKFTKYLRKIFISAAPKMKVTAE